MDDEAFELSWIGASGGCVDLPMNNHAVVAGTKLRLGLRHLRTAQEPRPEEVHVFAAYDKLMVRILARLTDSPYGTRLERLDLKPAVLTDFVSATDPWPLKPPPSINGRLEIYCSLKSDGSHRGPSVTSLAYQTVEHVGTAAPRDMKGSVDIKGIGPKIELSGGNSVTTTFTAVAALDPQLYVDALVPGDGDFEEHLFDYLHYVASATGLNTKDLQSTFYEEYGGLVDRAWAKRIEVHFEPRFFSLEAEQQQVVQLRVVRHGSLAQPALIAIRLRDTECRELFTVSDFIVVDDDVSSIQVDHGPQGATIRTRRQ